MNTVEEQINVIKAFNEDKEVEYRAFDEIGSWRPVDSCAFDFQHNSYRVKEEPSYMKIGSESIEKLRELLKNTKDIKNATFAFSRNEISNLLNAMTNMKSVIINNMPLKELYKEELDQYRKKKYPRR